MLTQNTKQYTLTKHHLSLSLYLAKKYFTNLPRPVQVKDVKDINFSNTKLMSFLTLQFNAHIHSVGLPIQNYSRLHKMANREPC